MRNGKKSQEQGCLCQVRFRVFQDHIYLVGLKTGDKKGGAPSFRVGMGPNEAQNGATVTDSDQYSVVKSGVSLIPKNIDVLLTIVSVLLYLPNCSFYR